MSKKEKSNTTEAKKRGGRLRECRGAVKGMTQAKLAKLCDCDEKYISAFETGSRMINEKQAMLFGEKLNVNPYYLMCKTDRKTPIEPFLIDAEGDNSIDTQIIRCLVLLGFSIRAIVRPIYNERPEEIIVNILELKDLNINWPLCRLEKDGNTQEVCLVTIIVNNNHYPVNAFRMLLFYLEKAMENSVNNLFDFFLENAIIQQSENVRAMVIESAEQGGTKQLADLVPLDRGYLSEIRKTLAANSEKNSKNP